MWNRKSKPLQDLIEIIHFTENVAAKIHGVLEGAEIFRIAKEEFVKSGKYSMSVLLLTDDGLKLRIAETSLALDQRKVGEKLVGQRLKDYRIDLNKSDIYRQVVKEGRTLQVTVGETLEGLFPWQIAYLVANVLGLEKKPCILTPLKRNGKIIGVFAISSTALGECFIPSVKIFAQHISTALELADEIATRKRVEGALREARQRTNSQLNTLLEAIPDVVYFKDTQGRYLVVNKACEKLVGLRRKEILGKTDEQLLPPNLAEQCRRSDEEVIKRRRPIRVEERMTNDKGERIFFETIKCPLFDDQRDIRGLAGVSRDITERKRAEEVLKGSKEHLERVVKERTEKLSHLVESQKEFIAHIGHELRTPLSVIKAVAESEIDSNEHTSLAQQLTLVNRKVDQITQTLKNLMLVSRLDIGQEQIQKTKFKLKFLIEEVLEDVIQDARRENKDPQATFVCPETIELNTDRIKLLEVLTNLLQNAVTHAHRQPCILLKAEKQGDRVRIAVEDNNPPILKEDFERVFEKFYRGKRVRGKAGSGLGLYISRRLVELMGGKIWAERGGRVGNRFIVELPVDVR